ncbi:MAG: T9SS type A sorting domain-containing protein [Bacteroidota bacterium]
MIDTLTRLLPLLCFLISTNGFSQVLDRKEVPISLSTTPLPFPGAGGLNTPQLSNVDFNNDGVEDLYIFDRVGNAQLAFIRTEEGWSFEPSYIKNFPLLEEWVLLRDYNNDGIQDIFAYAFDGPVGGFIVYTGSYNAQNEIVFERYDFDWLYNMAVFTQATGNVTNIAITNIDYPAVDDVDCDGDMDILTFNLFGGYLELFRNVAVEEGLGLGTLKFELADNCWGKFYESGFAPEVELSTSSGLCATSFTGGEEVEDRSRHAGSTILSLDLNGDDTKDLILGDLSFNNLVALYNTGDCDGAWMTSQDPFFPSENITADINIFPASFYVDVDGDQKRDLMAAPNPINSAEDREALWYYKNMGTDENPSFSFQQTDFLIDQMLDLGSGARPVFVDYNADGLMDMVIGNEGIFQPLGGNKRSSLYLFENVGTISNPSYQLVDDDYLGMSAYVSYYGFTPTFGDLDGDGDEDVLIGEFNGQLFHAENTAGPGAPFEFTPVLYAYMGIDIGLESVPYIVDLDRDGKQDIVIGEYNGVVNFFKNQGTEGEAFFAPDQAIAPNTERLGNLDARTPGSFIGRSSPTIIDSNGSYLFFMGTNKGRIETYTDVELSIYESFEPLQESYGRLREGAVTHCDLADIDNDGLYEMVVGNLRGGIAFFETEIEAADPVSTTSQWLASGYSLFPNPARDRLFLTSDQSEERTVKLFNVSGQLMQDYNWNTSQLELDVSDLPKGVYVVQLLEEQGIFTQKIVVE